MTTTTLDLSSAAFYARAPAYTDPDLETIRSACPSYTSSKAPSYHSAVLPAGPVQLPPATPSSTNSQRYTSLLAPSLTSHHQFNVASWPSLQNPGHSRAYLNVAARRARRAEMEEQIEADARVIRRVLMGSSSSSSLGRLREVDEPAAGASTNSPPSVNTTEQWLMGSDGMGSGGRESRWEDPLVTEQKAWNFFTSQINDWEQREASWALFREKHQKRKNKVKAFGRRFGVYGRFG